MPIMITSCLLKTVEKESRNIGLTTPIIINLPIALQLLWKGLFGRGSSMLAKKISHPVEPSTLKSRHRRDRHVRQVKYDTGWGTEASQSANPRPLRARKERDEQGQKGGGKKEDAIGGMQDGGRGLPDGPPPFSQKTGTTLASVGR